MTPRGGSRRGRIPVARRAAAVILSAALAGGLGSGCGPRPTGPPRPVTAAPKPVPGYDHRVDDLASVDTSAFAGKRIALDPGHGGIFRGALGVHGLTEAEVNLGVAHF